MNCQNARELLSVLYDGEPVPAEFVDHVDTCQNCRESLRAYSAIGAELRLLASRNSISAVSPPVFSPILYRGKSRSSRFFSITERIPVPKLFVAAAAGLLVVMTAGLIRAHAQEGSPLWFQFTLREKGKSMGDGLPTQYLAQAGYDDYLASGESQHQFGAHIRVSSIHADRVEISVRSSLYHATNSDDMPLKTDLANFTEGLLTYHPGEPLDIPVEGGGTLILEGKIVDHKPRFMSFGIPLEPSSDQLILTSPVLISGNKVLVNRNGANAMQNGLDGAVVLYAPGTGLLKVALQPFPGAVPAVASWGNLNFRLGGRNYTLLTASQICGGDQPRALWAGINAEFRPLDPHLSGGFISTDKSSDPAF